MAIIPSSRYPSQIDIGVTGYPQGKARNAGSFQDGTGTPLEKDWLNDLFGLEQALLSAAGITPSGTPDKVGASQYLEAIQTIAGSGGRTLAVAALRLRQLSLPGTTISDTAESMAAIHTGAPNDILAIKVNTTGVARVTDADLYRLGGALTSITSLVTGAAFNGASRIVVIGTGGNRCCYSDDQGGTWTAGGSLVGTPEAIVWDATHSRFICIQGSTARYSTNAVGWTSVAVGKATSGGLAVLSNGHTIACGDGVSVDFTKSTDGGATWTDTGGTIANATDSPDAGWIVGNAGTEVFHIIRRTAGNNSFQVSASADGATWVTRVNFPVPDAPNHVANRPKILMCQNTGLLVAVMPITDGVLGKTMLAASLDRGLTWTETFYFPDTAVNAFAVAGGRLFATRDSMLLASDGIGL